MDLELSQSSEIHMESSFVWDNHPHHLLVTLGGLFLGQTRWCDLKQNQFVIGQAQVEQHVHADTFSQMCRLWITEYVFRTSCLTL